MSIEREILSISTTLINVSYILFKENIDMYDKIFLVQNGKVKKSIHKERFINNFN